MRQIEAACVAALMPALALGLGRQERAWVPVGDDHELAATRSTSLGSRQGTALFVHGTVGRALGRSALLELR